MADNLTREQRSYAMSRIRARGNAATELRMVGVLRSAGITGWRRHVAMHGKPDFVFQKERVAIFVDGCFWHRCPRCFRLPTTNVEYWEQKTRRNSERDRRTTNELQVAGWRVLRVWQHSLRHPTRVAQRVKTALEA